MPQEESDGNYGCIIAIVRIEQEHLFGDLFRKKWQNYFKIAKDFSLSTESQFSYGMYSLYNLFDAIAVSQKSPLMAWI